MGMQANDALRSAELARIIGPGAATLVLEGDRWTALGGAGVLFVGIPLGVWAQVADSAGIGLMAGLVYALTCGLLIRGVLAGRRSVQEANAHVSDHLGYAVRLHPGGRGAQRWVKAIARERGRHRELSRSR